MASTSTFLSDVITRARLTEPRFAEKPNTMKVLTRTYFPHVATQSKSVKLQTAWTQKALTLWALKRPLWTAKAAVLVAQCCINKVFVFHGHVKDWQSQRHRDKSSIPKQLNYTVLLTTYRCKHCSGNVANMIAQVLFKNKDHYQKSNNTY